MTAACNAKARFGPPRRNSMSLGEAYRFLRNAQCADVSVVVAPFGLHVGLRQRGKNLFLAHSPGTYSSSRHAETRKRTGLLSVVPYGTGFWSCRTAWASQSALRSCNRVWRPSIAIERVAVLRHQPWDRTEDRQLCGRSRLRRPAIAGRTGRSEEHT